MAIQVVVEKDQGTKEAPSLPVVVWDDTGAFLTLAAAQAAVDAAAGTIVPITYDGLPNDGNPGQQRLSKSAWRFTINYRLAGQRPNRPPAIGDYRAGFNWRLPRKWVQFAPEVARFPAIARASGGIIAQVWDANMNPVSSGAWIEPPAPNLSATLAVAPATVTGSWVRSIASLMGVVNSVPLTGGAYQAGEIILVSAVGSRISDQSFLLDFGWNWTPNVSGETRDGVTGVNYNGQDYVWDGLAPTLGPDVEPVIAWSIISTYVHRVRIYGDLASLGVEPP